jgi:hypothetical protein
MTKTIAAACFVGATCTASLPLAAGLLAAGLMATVLTGDAINQYRALALLSALKLEVLGMKRRGPSVYSVVKREYNLKGSKQSVYDQLKSLLG